MQFELKDIVRAYIAGLTDGEGCIHIQKRYDSRPGREKYYYAVHVIYAMTNKEPLSFVQTHYGGTLDTKPPTPSNKTVFRLTLCGYNALQLLEEIEPFLLVKYRLAKAAIALQKHINSNQSGIRYNDGTVLADREVLYQAYRAAAETERAGVPVEERSDSPTLNDGKVEI